MCASPIRIQQHFEAWLSQRMVDCTIEHSKTVHCAVARTPGNTIEHIAPDCRNTMLDRVLPFKWQFTYYGNTSSASYRRYAPSALEQACTRTASCKIDHCCNSLRIETIVYGIWCSVVHHLTAGVLLLLLMRSIVSAGNSRSAAAAATPPRQALSSPCACRECERLERIHRGHRGRRLSHSIWSKRTER